MVRKQEEMIAQYFERGMTPKEEQNFLITLAASDQLRIAFRSHLELSRAVRDDKDELRSVAQVRNRTFAALGLSAAAVSPFLEQELVNSARSASQLETAGIDQGFFARIPQFLKTRTFSLGSGLLVGFSAAIGLLNISPNAESGSQHASSVVSRPATESVSTAQPAENLVPTANETIPGAKALNREAIGGQSTSPLTASPAITAEPSNGLERARHAAAVHGTSVLTSHSRPAHSSPGSELEVVKSNPGTMSARPLKIAKPGDSAKAK